jgi:hypothetical protein
MDAKRWGQIKESYDHALDLCGDDCKHSAPSARGYHRLSLVNSPTARRRPDHGG